MWQSTDEESSLKDAFLTDFAISLIAIRSSQLAFAVLSL
jgi:hypothetical protein